MAQQRRSSGEGSVFQRADGYWCGAIRTGGKRRVVYAKTRKAVAAKLATLQQAASTGKLVETSRLTVAGFLAEWLETRRTNLRPSTWASYEELLRLHVVPILGDLRLQNLRPLHLVRLYAD